MPPLISALYASMSWIAVTASRRGVPGAADVELDVLARRIIEAVVDEFDVDATGAVSIRKRLVADGVA